MPWTLPPLQAQLWQHIGSQHRCPRCCEGKWCEIFSQVLEGGGRGLGRTGNDVSAPYQSYSSGYLETRKTTFSRPLTPPPGPDQNRMEPLIFQGPQDRHQRRWLGRTEPSAPNINCPNERPHLAKWTVLDGGPETPRRSQKKEKV